MIEKKFALSIKAMQTDRGLKFKPMVTQLECEGVVHRCTCPHTSHISAKWSCRV